LFVLKSFKILGGLDCGGLGWDSELETTVDCTFRFLCDKDGSSSSTAGFEIGLSFPLGSSGDEDNFRLLLGGPVEASIDERLCSTLL